MSDWLFSIRQILLKFPDFSLANKFSWKWQLWKILILLGVKLFFNVQAILSNFKENFVNLHADFGKMLENFSEMFKNIYFNFGKIMKKL